jgi:signal transduction histidine kinase
VKPLNLYLKTTLLVLAVLIPVLLAVVFSFNYTSREIERRDQQQLARRWIEQLQDKIANAVDEEAQRDYAIIFKDAHESGLSDTIEEIRLYVVRTVNKKRQLTQDAVISDKKGEEPQPVSEADLALLRKGQIIIRAREITQKADKTSAAETWREVFAAAPLINEKSSLTGAITMKVRRRSASAFSQRLLYLTIALMAAATLAIAAQLYFLFSQVIYQPVADLLKTMSRIKSGDLDVAVPVRARDEFGQLATSFNHMITRLRSMTAEREAYQKQLEERIHDATSTLAERNEQLEEVNASLFELQRELTKFERLAAAGQLAAQFAHEVGTPLNLISGHVQLLQARTDDAKTRDRLELIGSQIARIERIVRNMLDATRRPQPELSPLDLNGLLRRIFEITAPTLAARQVELVAELTETNLLINGDSEQLQQVFINLINNSLDAMPQGGTLTFQSELIRENDTDNARIICRDTGTGISEEIRGRIFDPLFTTKLRGKGSGLGLSVVQQIVRDHSGTISLESIEGEGAEFHITLPLMQPAQWHQTATATSRDEHSEPATING